MSDLTALNDAINKRAGRKLLPSIGVGLLLIALVWVTLSYERVLFAIVVGVAVSLGVSLGDSVGVLVGDEVVVSGSLGFWVVPQFG